MAPGNTNITEPCLPLVLAILRDCSFQHLIFRVLPNLSNTVQLSGKRSSLHDELTVHAETTNGVNVRGCFFQLDEND